MPTTRISLTHSCHHSLSSISPGRSSILHAVSAQSCCMYVLAGRLAFPRPCEGVYRSMSLLSLSLLLQQYKLFICMKTDLALDNLQSVVYWPPTPPNMPFQRQRKCIFHLCGRAWLTIWDRVKIPRYSHKLMHRKRVTCELQDSYFRLMTIKHAISKTRKCIFRWPVMGRYWVGVWLLYNSVKTGSQLVWRRDAVEKASTQQKGPSGPPNSWRQEW